jgi:hypothetical protein
VRLIRLAEGERLTGIERIEHLEGEVVDEAAGGEVGDTAAPPEGAPESEN